MAVSVRVAAAVEAEAVRRTMTRNPYASAPPIAEVARNRLIPWSAPSGHLDLDNIGVKGIERRGARGRLRGAENDCNTNGASQRESS